ncbi:hypothetical protein E0M25_28220 [Bacillus mycoides]|nr:hypothetical protein EXW38_29390 [Bacillus mycoides]TBX70820.1 hypothetical protein E0M25_28220 [Bacillus mycoides]
MFFLIILILLKRISNIYHLETSTWISLSLEGLERRFNSASVSFFTTLLQAKIGGLSKIS